MLTKRRSYISALSVWQIEAAGGLHLDLLAALISRCIQEKLRLAKKRDVRFVSIPETGFGTSEIACAASRSAI